MSRFFLFGFVFLLAGPLYGEDLPEPEVREFRAVVSSVRLNSALFSQGKRGDDEVSVRVRAILFEEPLVIADVRTAEPHGLGEVRRLIAYTRVNIEGEPVEVLAFWTPRERDEKAKFLDKPDMFKANRDYHVANPGLRVVGVVYQERTSSVLIERFGNVLGVTFEKIDGVYFLTDRRSNDLELAIVEASLSG